MKREKTARWLYFRMLYCTGAQLTFIGWFCGTGPINGVMLLRHLASTEERSFWEYACALHQPKLDR